MKTNSVNGGTCMKCGEKNCQIIGLNIHKCKTKPVSKTKLSDYGNAKIFRYEVLEELRADVKYRIDTSATDELLRFWQEVDYWLYTKKLDYEKLS